MEHYTELAMIVNRQKTTSHWKEEHDYSFHMETFLAWVHECMRDSGLEQADIVRRSKEAGYPISSGHLSRIMGGSRDAGADAVISLAYGLGVTLEEAFRARGWLKQRTSPARQIGEIAETLDEGRRSTLLEVARALAGRATKSNAPTADEVEAYIRQMEGVELVRYLLEALRREQPENAERLLRGALAEVRGHSEHEQAGGSEGSAPSPQAV